MNNREQRYLIAKYADDLARMEPKNIGVILWAAKRLRAQFLPTDAIPFIKDKKMYARWTKFWSEAIEQKCIRMKNGATVLADQPEFLDAILDTQRGNFLLFDSGFVAEKINVRDIDSAAAFLFNKLIVNPRSLDHRIAEEVSAVPHLTSAQMERICTKIFSEAGILERQDFKKTKPVPCKVGRAVRDFTPHYSLLPKVTPVAVWQRVDVTQAAEVDSASFMFEHMLKSKIVKSKKRCGAMIHGATIDRQVSGALATLNEYSVVIDIDDTSAARAQAEDVAFGQRR